MSESLRNALETREMPIVSRQILATGEDFVLTFLESNRVVDTGFLLFKLDTELYKGWVKFSFPYIMTPGHQIFQILVPILIVQSRHKSFEEYFFSLAKIFLLQLV